MAIKVGINGFGRIGRVALRIMVERGCNSYQICGINLRNADLDYMVYQVKYDSVFRNFNGTVEHIGGDLVLNGHKIKVFSESDAALIPWSTCGMTQATILGVSTWTYLHYCIFNLVSPLMSIVVAATGYRIFRHRRPKAAAEPI